MKLPGLLPPTTTSTTSRPTTTTTLDSPLVPALIAAWSFDEVTGSVARDASGNGHDGAVNGAAWGTGVFGGGLTFDGTDDSVRIADAPALNPTEAISITAWIRSPLARTSTIGV